MDCRRTAVLIIRDKKLIIELDTHIVPPQESPLLWTRGVAARETLSYLDRRGIDPEPALVGAGISRRQLSQDNIVVPAASQYRFLELAAAEANDQLLGLHVAADMDLRSLAFCSTLPGRRELSPKRS